MLYVRVKKRPSNEEATMTTELEILEILDNWSDAEIKIELARFQKALELRADWENLSRAEKDSAWHKAEE
jgi:hypothetical protein